MTLHGTIVFASGRAGDFDIFTLQLESGAIGQLTSGSHLNDHPRWSPDGSTVAFISNRSGIHQIWLMDADGRNQRQLTSDNVHHAYPVWAPDGRSLACCANYQDKTEINIWRVFLESGRAPELLVEGTGVESEPSFSPDGQKLVYAANHSGNYDIWELNLSSRERRPLTAHVSRDYAPSYSPDGKMIAFISTPEWTPDMKRPSTNSDVWIMLAEPGKEPLKITANKSADMHVGWSPDGNHLVFCAGGFSVGTARLKVIDLEQGRLQSLSYDRSALDQEITAGVTDRSLLDAITPDFIQRAFVYMENPAYFGSERYPHWKR